MQRGYQTYSPPSGPPFPSQQNKVILQREYREKEGECFSILRDVIKDLTGEELRTRQEILRKAIDILSTASEFSRKQSGTPSPTKPDDTAAGDFTQPYQSWWSGVESDASYDVHFHDQQHHFMSGMSVESAFNQASSSGYTEDWFLTQEF